MGKGTIKSGGEDGLYQLTIRYNRVKYERTIELLSQKIAELDEEIAKVEIDFNNAVLSGIPNRRIPFKIKLDTLKAQRLSVKKRKDYLESKFPDDEDVSAWCADFTEDLTGDVITVEVPGERGIIQIAPGFEGKAAYKPEAGQLMPSVITSPHQAYLVTCLYPGWQKWKPTFRYGTIKNIDYEDHKADVDLDDAISTFGGRNVNQNQTLEGVSIEYMDCNSSPFEDGDSVLLKFTGLDWANPVIIGFKEEPKPCAVECLLIKIIGGIDKAIVVLCETGALAEKIPDGNGGFLTFPCNISDLDYWIAHSDPIAEKQDDYWIKSVFTEDRGDQGYITKIGEFVEPGSESFWCNSDELSSSWGPDDASLSGDVVCYESRMLGLIGSTYANLSCEQKRVYSVVNGPENDCYYGMTVALYWGGCGYFVYTPHVFFDSGMDESIEIVNGTYYHSCTTVIDAPNGCGPTYQTDPNAGRAVQNAIEKLPTIQLDLDIIATEKSCVQLFKNRTVTNRRGTYMKEWAAAYGMVCCVTSLGCGPGDYPEEHRFEEIFEYRSIASEPKFFFTAALDYKQEKITVEGLNPRNSAKNSVISDFINQYADSVGGDFYPEWIQASFRTQR